MPNYDELTGKIIGCFFEVINELGAGFVESVYEKALLVALHDKGLKAESQVPIRVNFRNHCVGEFFADIVVENNVTIELKAVKALMPEHQAQVINYLKASDIKDGLLVNFGNPRIEFTRLYG